MGRPPTTSSKVLPALLLIVIGLQLVSAAVFSCTGGSVYVVAHPDDDLLFQSPDIYGDIAAGNCVTAVYLTSGDSGIGSTYALSREAGAEASHANMTGVADRWTEFTAMFGGQPVTVRTLVDAPHIQKVWFRLPDGGINGLGNAATGYQSLRELYFGSISSITSQPGTSTFTLATLKTAVGQILTARQPVNVRTLDYLSDFDSGDHSDHLTVARLTQMLTAGYAPSASLSGYMGYHIASLAPTMSQSDVTFQNKSNAFFILPSNDGAAQTPAVLPTSGTNVALLAVATASSFSSGQPPSAMNDNNIQGYPGNASAEWSSDHGLRGTQATLTWSAQYNISAVVLYDRVNPTDRITSGTLSFADGSIQAFGALPNDGSAYVITFSTPKITTFVTLTVDSVSSTTSGVGLAEFAAYGTLATLSTSTSSSAASATTSSAVYSGPYSLVNLAFSATVSASAEDTASHQQATRAVDGINSGYTEDGYGDYTTEWSSNKANVGATLTLTWSSAVQIAKVVLRDRPNMSDQVTGGILTFQDGSTVLVPALANDGSPTPIYFNPKTTTYVIFQITAISASTGSAGLSEIQAFGPASSSTAAGIGPINWARYATASASSQSPHQGANKAIDNLLDGYTPSGGDGYDEWASDHGAVGTTFTLTWAEPVTLSSLVLRDRPNTGDWIQGANITFSDGGVAMLSSLDNSGSATIFNLGSVVTITSLVLKGLVLRVRIRKQHSQQQQLPASHHALLFFCDGPDGHSTDVVQPAVFYLHHYIHRIIDRLGLCISIYSCILGPTTEWSSNKVNVGATLTLTWSSAVQIAMVQLFDRPNLDDQVTGGLLTFQDGSTVNVPALANDGSATTIYFDVRSTTYVTFQITAVSASTGHRLPVYLFRGIVRNYTLLPRELADPSLLRTTSNIQQSQINFIERRVGQHFAADIQLIDVYIDANQQLHLGRLPLSCIRVFLVLELIIVERGVVERRGVVEPFGLERQQLHALLDDCLVLVEQWYQHFFKLDIVELCSFFFSDIRFCLELRNIDRQQQLVIDILQH
ncbi:hypothetical protein RQP46_006801 [Phenoliferia psychrophenolica]